MVKDFGYVDDPNICFELGEWIQVFDSNSCLLMRCGNMDHPSLIQPFDNVVVMLELFCWIVLYTQNLF